VIFKPKLPSAPYFLNEGRFFIDIWRNIFDWYLEKLCHLLRFRVSTSLLC
jgi:hypothetical protein